MRVELEKTIDYDSYDNFIRKIRNPTFYQSTKHLKFLEDLLDSKAMMISAKENNELVGVLPFFYKRNNTW